MDVSIIGCIVNGPGEATVSDLGLTGSSKKSGFYLDGVRQKERLDNNDLIDALETRIRNKAQLMSAQNKIDIKQVDH